MAYHDLTGRWWNKVNLPMDDWLRIVKLFELELSSRKIAIQLELPYKTIWKAVMVIRHAIFCHAADVNKILMSGEIELVESYFGGRRKGNRSRGAAGTNIKTNTKKGTETGINTEIRTESNTETDINIEICTETDISDRIFSLIELEPTNYP